MSLQLRTVDKDKLQSVYQQILERVRSLAQQTKDGTLAELVMCYRNLKTITETHDGCCDEREETYNDDLMHILDDVDNLRWEIEAYLHNFQMFTEFLTEGETIND